jgi:putative transposase
MQRAFCYRLYPTQQQECLLLDTLETLRHLYNNALAERIDAYKQEGRRIGYVEQANQLPSLKKRALPLSQVYSQVAQEALKRLDRAYRQFFQRVKAGDKPGFPRFKGSGQYSSLTYPHYASGVQLNGDLLHLSKIGDIPVRLHRPLYGTPKTCTISRKADGWYACICCEVEPEPLPAGGQDVGIDIGIENFATLTDDHEPIANPRHLQLQQAQAHLKKAQRRLERRTKRDKNRKLLAKQSKRREKAKVLLAKAHQRVQRARLDFQHKLAHALVRQFDTLYVENLNITGMLTNHHLARVISDAAWGQFFLVLKHKAESAVKTVIEVCPKNTSQNCSSCGEYVPKALSVRTHACPYCGLALHRDKNAAENIRNAGRHVLSAQRAGTPPSDANVGAIRLCVV